MRISALDASQMSFDSTKWKVYSYANESFKLYDAMRKWLDEDFRSKHVVDEF